MFFFLLYNENTNRGTYITSRYQCIGHEFEPRSCCGYVVETVCSPERLVCLVMHYRAWQRVIANHIGNFTIFFYYKSINNLVLWEEPMSELLDGEDWSQVKFFQILMHK